MSLKQFVKQNRYLLGFGFLMAFTSSFGQTFLLSLYLPFLQEEFSLSDGGFSGIYSLATLLSAFTITWIGPYIDRVRLTNFTLLMLCGLIVSLVFFSQSYHVLFLFISLYGLRLFGQGMMTHISITSMARFFEANRGKAISLASLGYSFGEVVLPLVIVTFIGLVNWRYTVLLTLLFVLLVMPLSLFLLRKNSNFSQLRKYIPLPFNQDEKQKAKPIEIMKTKGFWILLPSSLAAASIGTGFLLFKLKLGLSKGWEPTFIAGGFTAYALGNAFSNLLAGFLADKFSGRVLFPFYLFPFMTGLIFLYFFDDWWVYLILIAGIGVTNGFGSTVKNVAMAEIYGTRIIGSVRSLFTTITVFSTAIGPALFGFFLDAGYSYEFLALISIVFFAFCTLNAMRIFIN